MRGRVRGISGAVLVGGESRRMGRDKAMLSVDGQPLVQHVVGVLREVVDEVLLVGTGAERYGWLDARIVDDLIPGAGPLGGIHTALSSASRSRCLVVACDMPFLNLGLLRYMLQEAVGWDVVVPRSRGRLEPLHSAYARSCLRPIERMLENGELCPLDLFPRVSVRYLETQEVERLDPRRLSFVNLNTPDDLVLTRALGGASEWDDVDKEIELPTDRHPTRGTPLPARLDRRLFSAFTGITHSRKESMRNHLGGKA